MSASLCPEEMKLNNASGLRTPSHIAIPGSVPMLRASGGKAHASKHTPSSSSARKTSTWKTSELPVSAATRLSETKSGP